MVDQLIDECLPYSFKEIRSADHIIKTGKPKRMKAVDIQRVAASMRLIDELNDIGNKPPRWRTNRQRVLASITA